MDVDRTATQLWTGMNSVSQDPGITNTWETEMKLETTKADTYYNDRQYYVAIYLVQ